MFRERSRMHNSNHPGTEHCFRSSQKYSNYDNEDARTFTKKVTNESKEGIFSTRDTTQPRRGGQTCQRRVQHIPAQNRIRDRILRRNHLQRMAQEEVTTLENESGVRWKQQNYTLHRPERARLIQRNDPQSGSRRTMEYKRITLM